MIFDVDKIITEFLVDDSGESYFLEKNRTFIRDILMDYVQNKRDPQYVLQMLKVFLSDKGLSVLQLYGLLGAIQELEDRRNAEEKNL